MRVLGEEITVQACRTILQNLRGRCQSKMA
jgi:hypothetical protein